MALSDRCDHIVRLIDETLVSVGAGSGADIDISAHPSGASLVRRTAPPLTMVIGLRDRGGDDDSTPGGGAPRESAEARRRDPGGTGRDRRGRDRSVARLRALYDHGVADL
jgi:hypothetical protein